MPFSIYDVKVCSILYNLLYQFSQFSFSMKHLKLRKQEMAELLSIDHHKAPRKEGWAIHGTAHHVTNCQYNTKFSIFNLNYNVSTPVIKSSSIIMCSYHGFSGENLVMQAH